MVQFLLTHGAAIEFPGDQPWTTTRFWAKHLEEPAILQALADWRYDVGVREPPAAGRPTLRCR
jgi:hypothetical protein